ncbi:MAG: CsoR family transcriptional regulator, copper-sensing transcriptional repressor [Gaiellales bacterium]|nr:CsoR family transcriptional regulator, copper-sensing transcriptional repressor [Gaiellales bacterium]
MSEKHVQPGYIASKNPLQARLKRIEGQVRGIQGMVEDERYCIDILTQISAIQAALDKVALGLLDDHAKHCVVGADDATTREARTEEMMAAVGRLMRRG